MNDEMNGQETFAEQEAASYVVNKDKPRAYEEYHYETYEEVKAEPAGVGFGIASLVLGIISLVLFCTCCNVIFAVLAIIFGIIQITKKSGKGIAIGGIITAALSIIFCAIFWAFSFASAGTDSFLEEYKREYNRILQNGNYTYDYDFDDYNFDDDDTL